MSDADYRAWVEVLPDFKNFNAQVQQSVVAGMGSAGSQGSAAMGGTLIAGVGKFAGPLAIAVAALGIGSMIFDAAKSGIDATIDYTKRSVSAGSDLNESINAVTVAYGAQADAVLALGKDSARTYGLTANDINEFAVRFSGFSTKIAGDGGRVSDTLADLLGRGTDFASVYNIDVAEALTLFQSGLAGEMEPLRRYGIDLSAATLASYAYANGIAEQGKQLTETQRVQAAYGSLMEQTTNTQGDFKNTSDQLANAQRIVQAELESVSAEFGTQFLPILGEVVSFARDELLPIWSDFNKVIGPALAAALELNWDSLTRLWDELNRLFKNLIPDGVNVLTLLAGGIITVAVMLATGIDIIAAYAEAWADFFAFLRGDMSLDELVKRSGDRMAELSSNFTTRIEEAGASLGRINEIADGLSEQSYLAGLGITSRLADGLTDGTVAAERAMYHAMEQVGAYLPRSPAKKGPFSGSGWDGIKQSGEAILGQLAAGMSHIDVPLSASIVGTAPAAGLSSALTPTAPVAGSASPIVQYVSVAPEQDPRIAGRQFGREFAREVAGGAV